LFIAKNRLMSHDNPTRNPDSSPRSSATLWLRLIFLPIFLAGMAFFTTATVRPLLQMFAARDWKQTACVIESSRVVTHQGDESTSYSIEVAYRYAWADRHYTSLRYSFVAGSWNGRRRNEAIVQQYPAGKETVCFVNANAPAEAVLNRGWRPEMGMGVFGLLIAFAGAIGLAFAGPVLQNKPPGTVRNDHSATISGPKNPIRPLHLLIAALFWNGFIGAIAYFLFFVEDREDIATGPKIIIGLFLLVGLALLWSALSQLTSRRMAK
jgi:hypothetical protein